MNADRKIKILLCNLIADYAKKPDMDVNDLSEFLHNYIEDIKSLFQTPIVDRKQAEEILKSHYRKNKVCIVTSNDIETTIDAMLDFSQLSSHLPEITEEEMDLMQYVTNLLYYVRNKAYNLNPDEFDNWVQEKTDDIRDYYKSLGFPSERKEQKTTNSVDQDFENKLHEIYGLNQQKGTPFDEEIK